MQNDVTRCNRCGFCNAVCPTYKATGIESMGPRGRNIIARGVLEGDLEPDKRVDDAMFRCLLCRACEAACYPGVSTDRIVIDQRERYFQENGGSFILDYIFKKLLPDTAMMGYLCKMLALGKNSGIVDLVSKAGVLGWLYPSLDSASRLTGRFPGRFLREEIAGSVFKPLGKARARVGYFIGCGINFMMPKAGLATLKLLVEAGFEAIPLANCCCGLVAYNYGHMESALFMARKNIETIVDSGLDMVVTDCASCASFLAMYETLEMDVPASLKVVDITRLLADSNLEFDKRGAATYHDPCHLKRYLGVTEEPRSLLYGATEFVEMADADLCCGGAGTYSLKEAGLSASIMERKAKNIINTGVETVVSVCPSCIMHLKAGLVESGSSVEVVHISQMLIESLQKNRA